MPCWIAYAGFALTLVVASTGFAATQAEKCEAAKLVAAGRYGLCLQKEWRKALRVGRPADWAKCDHNFDSQWTAAERRFASDCRTLGDGAVRKADVFRHAAAMRAKLGGIPVTSWPSALPATGQTEPYTGGRHMLGYTGPVADDGTVQAGQPLHYVDNGDGTITDMATGLMWEKKCDDGGLHDQDNRYPWAGTATDTIWDWLDQVNAEGGAGFAGYSDWRVPNKRELDSIAHAESVDPAVDPVFESDCAEGCGVTACSCTRPRLYWSSTTYFGAPDFGWLVGFDLGRVSIIGKSWSHHIRAVRDGW